jgi:hypothetical protein
MAIIQQTLEKLQHFPLHPVASETATFTGATTNIADLKDFDGDIQVILDAGAAASTGTMAGKIQHSDTTETGDFSDATGGGFTAVAQAAAKQVLTLNRDALKRYIRFVGTIASSGTTIYSVNGYGLKKYG